MLRRGDKGVYVAVLQDALDFLGHNPGTIDGVFGSGTRNAVLRFQRANNLSADGIVGCNTWNKIVDQVKKQRNTPDTYEVD